MYTAQMNVILILATLALVNGGYLTGHHPIPSSLTTSSIISGGAIGGGPSSGAYSSSQFSQTVSSPAHIQSTISTYNPINHGSYGSSRNQGSNQGSQQSYGYSSNIPSVIAFGSYGNGQGQSGQGQIQGYGGQGNAGPGYGGQGNGFSGGHNSYTRF